MKITLDNITVNSPEEYFESYLLAEIYYCLYKIEPEKWKEHNGNAMRYAKRYMMTARSLQIIKQCKECMAQASLISI